MTGHKENGQYEIIVKGLRLYAYHGVYPEENKLGQEFEIDLNIAVAHSGSLKHDNLEQVLSYWEVIEKVKSLFTGKTFKLLESAAEMILESLSVYPLVKHARINLKKLTPAIPVTVDYVGIIMEKSYSVPEGSQEKL